ncbi:MAG: two-component sensor histidine kinase [Clostridiales bacterium]|nr:two-component sensor histidine kinase [Clostridiales bacterium]
MNDKMSPRMRAYYSLIVVIIVLFSGAMVTGVLFLLDALNVSYQLSYITLISIFVVAAVAGGMMSFFVGRRILAPMVKLSKASKEVARGNFSIAVSDSSKLEEVQTTFRNFNAMVRELNSISTLSNDFVANVSHEFKTPLTAIEGYAMLLQDPSLSAQEHGEYLDKILYNIHRLTTLVGNILMLSKIESKSLAEQYKKFRLDEQLRQAVVSLEPAWSEKNISFDVALDEVVFYGCESLLTHVWTNLLSNAIKFSPDGQQIHIRLLDQKECVVVSIQDHGCGMTPEVQRRIFEKFYQADSSHKAHGNGLGLSLVKRIVELSDGVIEVLSKPGEGSTFRVILPKY